MRKSSVSFMWIGALGLWVACGSGGGGGPEVHSFPLRTCDQDADCGEGFHCSPVYCADICIPDGTGKCLPCNGGKTGECLPNPPTPCEDITCPPGDQCVVLCNGACDRAKGMCENVSCVTACIPAPDECRSDADCGPGKHCEVLCAKGCDTPVFSMAGAPPVEKCPDAQCHGVCVDDPPPPTKCHKDADCPDGFLCEMVFCPMICAPDGQGGCLPCNDGYPGVCVPRPAWGCDSDDDCQPGEFCQVVCMGLCDAFTAGGKQGSDACYQEQCFGQCLVASGCAGVDCGPGFHCEWLCTPGCVEAMPAGAFRASDSTSPPCDPTFGECFAQCVPDPTPERPCQGDSDCPTGFVCEPVFCAQTETCLPDASGGCLSLPCNQGYFGVCVPAPQKGCQANSDCKPGERCEVYCMGLCDPTFGCGETCHGVCVPTGCGDGCPKGFACVSVCPACGPGMDCNAECIEECVPVGPQPDKCNQDADCSPGSHCEPVFCTMVCIDDGKGGCLPCNDGFLGRCEPDAQHGCAWDPDCAADERCEIVCTGLCPPGSYCTQSCFGVCVKKDAGCHADGDCPEGFYCEMMCPNDCGPVPPGAESPACVATKCLGQCVPKPSQCTGDVDCPAGYVCVEQSYCPPCVYSEPACTMPCTTQKVCVPPPKQGCRADSDCKPGQQCEVWCPMFCTPEDCDQFCVGHCVG